MKAVQVLDKGFVRLDGSMADDLSVVNAARVSLAKHSERSEDETCHARDKAVWRFL